MNSQQLIDHALTNHDLITTDIQIVSINYSTQAVTLITHNYQKYVTPFPVEPQPKRIKAIKKTS